MDSLISQDRQLLWHFRVFRVISFKLIIIDISYKSRKWLRLVYYYSQKEIAILQLDFEYRYPEFKKNSSFDANTMSRDIVASISLHVNLVRHLVQERIKNERGKKYRSPCRPYDRHSLRETRNPVLSLYGPLCWIHVHRSRGCTQHICSLVECTGRKRAHNGVGNILCSLLAPFPRHPLWPPLRHLVSTLLASLPSNGSFWQQARWSMSIYERISDFHP